MQRLMVLAINTKSCNVNQHKNSLMTAYKLTNVMLRSEQETATEGIKSHMAKGLKSNKHLMQAQVYGF